ncbi:HTH domain-containing protein [Rhodococcoides yunnanense]|uniref:HTH domain-containing protein n=1 Tax=Rhodococcoides yunnanense TaxID=278209 RepID=UPI001FE89697|nr:HTH domain-containing protein [Rhodococcus yunnanensis]
MCHHLPVNRSDRLYSVREELRRAGRSGRTAERLAEVFEVSVRTIKRDISALQQAGFPIWAQPGHDRQPQPLERGEIDARHRRIRPHRAALRRSRKQNKRRATTAR